MLKSLNQISCQSVTLPQSPDTSPYTPTPYNHPLHTDARAVQLRYCRATVESQLHSVSHIPLCQPAENGGLRITSETIAACRWEPRATIEKTAARGKTDSHNGNLLQRSQDRLANSILSITIPHKKIQRLYSKATPVAKDKQQKKKEREKRVAKKKLLEAAKRREIAKEDEDQGGNKGPRSKQVMTQGVKNKPQVTAAKMPSLPRRTGG